MRGRSPTYGGILTIGDTHAYMSDGELTGANWEEAVKVAWADMVALVMHLYNTAAEHSTHADPRWALAPQKPRRFQPPSLSRFAPALPLSCPIDTRTTISAVFGIRLYGRF
jgi:hypothetical protein